MSGTPVTPSKADRDDDTKHNGDSSMPEKRLAELKLEIPSPELDRIASISMSASGSSGSSKLLRVDERLHKWLEEEALQVSSPRGSSKAGQSMRLHAKILVSNSAAGSIIGKVGVNIHQTQLQTGAKVQLSKANEYFPGTIERTLLVKGNLSQIISALYSIYVRLIDENAAPILKDEDEDEDEAKPEEEVIPSKELEESTKGGQDILDRVASSVLQVKILVPDELCGIIVGKGGATIKWCAETTHTSIRVLTRKPPVSGALTHKIVTVRGHLVDILKAIAVFLLKQADDPEYTSYGHIPRTYVRGGVGQDWSGLLPYVPPYPYGYHPGMSFPPSSSPFVSVTVPVIPAHTSNMMRNFMQYSHYIQQMTGVFMKLESSPPEEGGLLVRFQGPQEQIHQARGLLSQLLSCSPDPASGTFEQPRFLF